MIICNHLSSKVPLLSFIISLTFCVDLRMIRLKRTCRGHGRNSSNAQKVVRHLKLGFEMLRFCPPTFDRAIRKVENHCLRLQAGLMLRSHLSSLQQIDTCAFQGINRPRRILCLITSIKSAKVRLDKSRILIFDNSFSRSPHEVQQMMNIVYA